MVNISTEVKQAALKAGVPVKQLEEQEAVRVRSQILSRFTTGLSSWREWIWECLPERATYIDHEGWRLIGEFSPSSPTILLFNWSFAKWPSLACAQLRLYTSYRGGAAV
jgi:hypothetical protein